MVHSIVDFLLTLVVGSMTRLGFLEQKFHKNIFSKTSKNYKKIEIFFFLIFFKIKILLSKVKSKNMCNQWNFEKNILKFFIEVNFLK